MVARSGSVDRWFAQARSAVRASEVARRNAGTCGGGLGAQDCALQMRAVPTAEPPRAPVALRAWGVRSPVRVAIVAGARSGPPLRSPRLFAAPIPASSTTFAQEAEDGGGATGADESSPCWPLPPECCDLSKGISVQPEGTPSDDGTSPSGEEDCASALEPEPDLEDETPTGDPKGDETSDTTPGKFGGGWSDGGGTGTDWDDWIPENWPGADVPTGETPTAPTTPNVPTGPTGTTGIDDDGGGGDDDRTDAEKFDDAFNDVLLPLLEWSEYFPKVGKCPECVDQEPISFCTMGLPTGEWCPHKAGRRFTGGVWWDFKWPKPCIEHRKCIGSNGQPSE